tara:strand:+ start:379 stop:591 length:213 start_codon:yes stop_codon:yes gene_type:complete
MKQKMWKIRLGKSVDSYKENEIIEVTNKQKLELESKKAKVHLIGSAYWKEIQQSKKKKKTKPKKSEEGDK